jgi:two-component system sensor histidine kinase KdpD
MAIKNCGDQRPSPEALLRQASREERGKLKIFLGAAPGVGKTFEMLREGAERLKEGLDVVIGVVETHGRVETEALVTPFEIIPSLQLDYRGRKLPEMDLDGVLTRSPKLVLVDEFAHTNVEGSRHPKRWQDVMELIDAGVDVYTTLNVQHVESLNDVIAAFTRVRVRETVPDSVFDDAEIEVVDLPPDELIQRLKDGKVYVPHEASRALSNFFSKQNLSALREMALRRAALSIDQQMLDHLDANALPGTFAAGERVLVAVSEIAGTEALVRSAKRLADALRASWTAVYIETPRALTFDEPDKNRIAAALRLAASLGATIATVPAETVIEGLKAQVLGMRATQLVIGKSRRSWWFELWHASVVEAMLKGSEGLAIHVIPSDKPPSPPRKGLLSTAARGTKITDYLIAAGLVGVTTGVCFIAERFIGTGSLDLLYLVPVILTASRFGLLPGMAAGVSAALAYNFFFLPPIYTFTIGAPQSVLTVLVLLGVAAFTSQLGGRLRSRAAIGVRGAQENAALAAFAQSLARVSNAEDTAKVVCDEVARLLEVNAAVLTERKGELVIVASQPPLTVIGPVDRAAAEWAWDRGETAGSGTATLNAADWQFHPLKTSMGTLAILGIAREDGRDPAPSDRAVLLSTLVGQAALAHERLRLETDNRSISVLEERDRLRVALLSSIGHDLRTPLTSVIGAIEGLAARDPFAPEVATARAEVQRLRRFLENLVDMVRIDSGALNLSIEAIDLTDAVAAAAHDLRDTLRNNPVSLKVPPDLPFVKADPRLLHHILINLLANAAQHGGSDKAIVVEGSRTAQAVLLTVRDSGPGLAPGAEKVIFETFAQGRGSDRTGGSGLGLAIVKGFASAMEMSVSARNAEAGGAELILTFGNDILIRSVEKDES